MTAPAAPPDQAARERALTPSASFIVQAPAGSGKTELLICRFLRVLACVKEPEEVLAVTFTHKAAGEMRSRITDALEAAAAGTPPAAAHLRTSYELACEVLRAPHRRAWQLDRHPARLGIGTIDALNAWLAGRAPLTAGSAGSAAISGTPKQPYTAAARATLGLLADEPELAAPVAVLLRHLDGDARRFEAMIVSMLPRRDQWLRHIVNGSGDRAAGERGLRELTEHGLRDVADSLGDKLAAELTSLLAYAADQVRENAPDASLACWAGRTRFPLPVAEELPAWQALADALLTAGDGSWRKRVDKRQGFPPGTREKVRMSALLAGLEGRDDLRGQVQELRILPGARYSDAQWQVLQTMIQVLKLAAAQLRIIFASRGQVDFPEVAAAALDALGREQSPSELGLALDYRLRHILIDEFQDTSLAQFDLLRLLTAGWTGDDGRTLFLVGDPMQSIYRFREAEVGLFLRVRRHGIGDVRPEFLQLTANFRSAPAVVTWNNRVFSTIFPPQEDVLLGAVSYAPSQPARPASETGEVCCHWLPAGDTRAEPDLVLDLVARARQSTAPEKICVLVRSRGHASGILAALRTRGIPFVAPEMESMERASVAQDLLALTRALGSRADRLAWLAVLRSPLCGLSLKDLCALLGDDHATPVPDLLRMEHRTAGLSGASDAAIRRLLATLERTSRAQERVSWRDLVEGAWLALGGPATLREPAEMETAQTFLALLETLETSPDGLDPVLLGMELGGQKGSLGGTAAGVQIMTIHKAKGLEFDVVIIPGLGKRPRSGDKPLLLWHDAPAGDADHGPILAPVSPSGLDTDPLHEYLACLEQRKQRLEDDRLLYVACTRAKRQLHLLARIRCQLNTATGELAVREPDARSLLNHIWPVVRADAETAAGRFARTAGTAGDSAQWIQPLVRRLPAGWTLPEIPAAVPVRGARDATGGKELLAYEWVSTWAMHAGAVVHHWLQLMAEQGLARFSPDRFNALEPEFRRMLERLDTEPADIGRAVRRVRDALLATLSDERGRWILSGAHAQARSEWALTIPEGEGFRNVVIDRTFVADGVRWIIDYKTSSHEGGDMETFLRLEAERYSGQLQSYRRVMRALGLEPVRTALYFPLLGRLLEVGEAQGA